MRPRTCFLPILFLAVAAAAAAQPYRTNSAPPAANADDERAQRNARTAPSVRPHFITVSYDWHYTHPLHFAEHPLADLLGAEVASTQFESYEYRTRDEATLIDVVAFSRRQRGLTLTVYPLGLSTGGTLALRGSIEPLPAIHLAFAGSAPFATYALTNARSLDLGAGIYMADRSPGWGLGSHAFLIGGIGRLTSDLGDGRRYFAEGGGGISVGPFGVDLSVKFAWNRLQEPVEHRFLTVPITLRSTFTF